MATLNSTDPHFVRCIIPNYKKRPGQLESDTVLEQLRCNGVLEGIRITRKGYPNRIVYSEFLKRYYLLIDGIPRTSADPKDEVNKLMQGISQLVKLTDYQFGHTKIFFRAGDVC